MRMFYKCLHAPTMSFKLTPIPESFCNNFLSIPILAKESIRVLGNCSERTESVIITCKLSQTQLSLG